ncbi:MAG: DNA polymerase Y family protein, partial [Polaromonas sp.]|nr:DNA polymerase Y family protein [Polaromonas sp.]
MRWIALQACTTEPGPLQLDAATAQRPIASLSRVQAQLASLALAFTPRVTVLDEAVLMDVTASLRLFGGLQRLVKLLMQSLALFFQSNNISAQSKYAYGATSLIALGKLRLPMPMPMPSRAGELPMHALSAARPHLDVLERTGCRTWNDLLELP